MWNLLNVVQVLTYTRNFTPWPALTDQVHMYLVEAIYLEQISSAVMEFGQTKFEQAQEMTKDEYVRELGIDSKSLAKNLGIIAISLALIVLIVILYLVCKYTCKSQSCWNKIAQYIKRKMFFNGIFRYVIVGYLKLMNQFAQMLLIGLATMEDLRLIFLSMLVVIVLLLWPVLTTAFLIRKRNKL